MSDQSKPTLYVFDGAIWPSAPWLAVYTLGYKDKINIEQVNLVKGENFAPEYVRKAPGAQLPALATPGEKTIVTTKAVVDHLIANAPVPAGKPSGTDFVKRIHEDSVDPNTALLSAHSEGELRAKDRNIPGLFIRGRQAALTQYSSQSDVSDLADFYKAKLEGNGSLAAIYDPEAPEALKSIWFTKSKSLWSSIRQFILVDIPAVLPESGYIGGAVPGEDDFHLAAWLGRMGAVVGGKNNDDGVLAFKRELEGQDVPENLVNYWRLWRTTEAWSEVFKTGLH